MKPVYYTKPSITEREVELALDAVKNGWGEKCYDYINQFEEAFKSYLQVDYAISTSSCTGAMHMGLAAMGIGPGDEVILADTNWVATVAPIIHLGATPIFVDILNDSWCINPEKVENAINPKTKAIIAVHLYGNVCEMDKLQKIGEHFNIPIIEDAAEAIGSKFNNKRAGSLGEFSCFSFHGTKTITTGEGGIFITNNSELYETVLTLSNHGRSRNQKKQFFPDVIGFKYKMSNLQAAIGCSQVSRIEELVSRKQEILKYYKESFMSLSGISMNPEYDGIENGAWMPTIVFDKSTGITSSELQSRFQDKNIDARAFFYPLSSLPMFEDIPSNKNSWDIPERAINLPSYHDMTSQDLDRVIEVVHSMY